MFCVDLQLTLYCMENYRVHLLQVIMEIALGACLWAQVGKSKIKLHIKYFGKKENIQL